MTRIYFCSNSVPALVGTWLMYSTSAVLCVQAEKAPNAMLSLADTDNNRTVDVRVGDTVQVTLRENATTGYRWAIDRCDEEFIAFIKTFIVKSCG